MGGGPWYAAGMELSDSLRARITEIIGSDDVVLFMKGSRRMPQCGFSAAVVQILDSLVPKYTTVNVLSDPDLRDGIKLFSSWPTIPQLYVRGEFLGGCDIVREMHASGELAQKLGAGAARAVGVPEPAAPVTPPRLRVSEAAARALLASVESEDDAVHIEISPDFEYGLYIGPRAPDDLEVQAGGLTFLLDAASARRADGLSIDFVEGPAGAGFKLESPHDPRGR